MKKKLLFCSYSLNIGGIEYALINLLKSINYDTYDVTLLLEKCSGELLEQLPKNVKLKEYKVSENSNIIVRKINNCIKRLSFFMKYRNAFDYSCCYATYSLPCNKISRIASYNNSIYVHSNYYDLFNRNDNETKSFFKKRQINRFKKIIFVSNESREQFLKIFPQLKHNSCVINNLIDSENIIKLSKKEIKEKKPKNIKLFCFVGRLDNESKNFKRLVETFKHVKIEYELWIIGDGPDKKFIEQLIEDNGLKDKIRLLGLKKNPYPYIKLADYIILTSNYEGNPVIYSEALVLKKRIITTINVSDEFYSIDDGYGIIVSKRPKEIANTINEIDKVLFKKIDFDFESINLKKMNILEGIFNGDKT